MDHKRRAVFQPGPTHKPRGLLRWSDHLRVFAEFAYQAESWDRVRRVIAKAEHLPGGDEGKANPRDVVTHLAGEPQHFYEAVYCQRGEAENRIKEQQLMLFAERTSCHRFVANPFRVLLAAAMRISSTVFTSRAR